MSATTDRTATPQCAVKRGDRVRITLDGDGWWVEGVVKSAEHNGPGYGHYIEVFPIGGTSWKVSGLSLGDYTYWKEGDEPGTVEKLEE